MECRDNFLLARTPLHNGFVSRENRFYAKNLSGSMLWELGCCWNTLPAFLAQGALWNRGFWTKGILENVNKLIEMFSVVNEYFFLSTILSLLQFHVFLGFFDFFFFEREEKKVFANVSWRVPPNCLANCGRAFAVPCVCVCVWVGVCVCVCVCVGKQPIPGLSLSFFCLFCLFSPAQVFWNTFLFSCVLCPGKTAV